MKKILPLIFIVLSGVVYGQNYRLFNAGSKKVYADFPQPRVARSLKFDTAFQSGTDSVYYNYFNVNANSILSDTCMFWGGNSCVQQNVPSWIGKKIIAGNNNHYTFFNLGDKSLAFDFAMNSSNPIQFYIDTVQKFQMVYLNSDTMHFMNTVDSIHTYEIHHMDLSGNAISSALNMQRIIIAKNFGLLSFFQVDSFPQVLRPLALIGDGVAEKGLYAITNEMLYDYQAGDEIQFHEFSNNSGGPPWLNYSNYVKYTILNKTVTDTTLNYNVFFEHYSVDSSVLHTGNSVLSYLRKGILAQIPFEKYDGYDHILMVQDYCGHPVWTYIYHGDNSHYFCAADTCWGGTDTGGPPMFVDSKLVLGVGVYQNTQGVFGPPPYGFSNGSQIVYLKKNGNICGSEYIIGIPEIGTNNNLVHVTPNPAKDQVTISSASMMKSIVIYNTRGMMLISKELSGTSEKINIGILRGGIYFAKIELINGVVEVRKIIVE